MTFEAGEEVFWVGPQPDPTKIKIERVRVVEKGPIPPGAVREWLNIERATGEVSFASAAHLFRSFEEAEAALVVEVLAAGRMSIRSEGCGGELVIQCGRGSGETGGALRIEVLKQRSAGC